VPRLRWSARGEGGPVSVGGRAAHGACSAIAGGSSKEAAVTADHQPAKDRMVVLRRQPVRIVGGQPDGSYTSLFEVICCYRGDHPDLVYCEVRPELQQIRGPYPDRYGHCRL
jgi:hypothetical protein